jgi:hypothetical protein
MGKVRVDVSCWYGYSAGATHYWVKITEGDWNEPDKRTFRSKFDTYEQAKEYVNGILSQHFPPDQFEYESTGETELRFVYDRVGD